MLPIVMVLCIVEEFSLYSQARTILVIIILSSVIKVLLSVMRGKEHGSQCDLTEDNIYLNMDRSKEKTCHYMKLPPLSVKRFHLQLIILSVATLLGGRIKEAGWRCCHFCFFDFPMFVLFLCCGGNNAETFSKCSVFMKEGHTQMYMYTCKHIPTSDVLLKERPLGTVQTA